MQPIRTCFTYTYKVTCKADKEMKWQKQLAREDPRL